MSQLYAGFGRVNATPMMGIFVWGYFKPRYASGVLDELEINALALSCGEERVVLLSFDHCETEPAIMDGFRKAVSDATGIPVAGVFIHCTHTHTGPEMTTVEPGETDEKHKLVAEYIRFVEHKMVDAAKAALDDLKPAKMGWAVSSAPGISFIRRFRMKDGSIRTNPGLHNPDVIGPVGEPDERVNVVRFDQEGGSSIVLFNFGTHPDCIGGDKISADWPGFARRTIERALDNTRAIFFNGAEGDVNHINTQPKGGDLNGMFMDFDDVTRGYSHARHMGNVLAGAVMQVYEKVAWSEVESIRFVERTIKVPSNMPKPEELPEAHRINDLYVAGRDNELPYEGMMLTTIVAEAARMVKLEHGPEYFDMSLVGVAVGNIAFCGIPGEPFTGIGLGLKAAPGWDMVLPCCLVNGTFDYFPMQEAFDEGGYEARSSKFKPGVAEQIIEEGVEMLSGLRGE